VFAFQVADAGKVDADADFEEAEADERWGRGFDDGGDDERDACDQEGGGEEVGVGDQLVFGDELVENQRPEHH